MTIQVVEQKTMVAQGFGLGGFKDPGLKVAVNFYADGSIEVTPWPWFLGETQTLWLRPVKNSVKKSENSVDNSEADG